MPRSNDNWPDIAVKVPLINSMLRTMVISSNKKHRSLITHAAHPDIGI
jgi:hypothetical protein